jgi:serine/threonine protein phosphatase 1
MRGRTIAIGDIHGCSTALDALLRALAPAGDDTLVVLGDVVDRGPDTRGCIDRLLDLRKQCRLVHLMGNHEEMALDALAGGGWSQAWPAYGGDEMLASYGGSFDGIPPEHLDFIRSGQDFHQTESTIFAHAAVSPLWPMERQTDHYLRWSRLTGREPRHESGRRVICGHTAQPDGRPVVFDGWVCLDTCAYCPRGALSGLVVDDDLLYQADQAGATRGPVPLAEFAALSREQR